jgi:hypothetical protein
MNKPNNVPYQVQQIIEGLLNTRDNVYVRGNYRMRLDEIKLVIEQAIKKYDNELILSEGLKKPKKKVS